MNISKDIIDRIANEMKEKGAKFGLLPLISVLAALFERGGVTKAGMHARWRSLLPSGIGGDWEAQLWALQYFAVNPGEADNYHIDIGVVDFVLSKFPSGEIEWDDGALRAVLPSFRQNVFLSKGTHLLDAEGNKWYLHASSALVGKLPERCLVVGLPVVRQDQRGVRRELMFAQQVTFQQGFSFEGPLSLKRGRYGWEYYYGKKEIHWVKSGAPAAEQSPDFQLFFLREEAEVVNGKIRKFNEVADEAILRELTDQDLLPLIGQEKPDVVRLYLDQFSLPEVQNFVLNFRNEDGRNPLMYRVREALLPSNWEYQKDETSPLTKVERKYRPYIPSVVPQPYHESFPIIGRPVRYRGIKGKLTEEVDTASSDEIVERVASIMAAARHALEKSSYKLYFRDVKCPSDVSYASDFGDWYGTSSSHYTGNYGGLEVTRQKYDDYKDELPKMMVHLQEDYLQQMDHLGVPRDEAMSCLEEAVATKLSVLNERYDSFEESQLSLVYQIEEESGLLPQQYLADEVLSRHNDYFFIHERRLETLTMAAYAYVSARDTAIRSALANAELGMEVHAVDREKMCSLKEELEASIRDYEGENHVPYSEDVSISHTPEKSPRYLKTNELVARINEMEMVCAACGEKLHFSYTNHGHMWFHMCHGDGDDKLFIVEVNGRKWAELKREKNNLVLSTYPHEAREGDSLSIKPHEASPEALTPSAATPTSATVRRDEIPSRLNDHTCPHCGDKFSFYQEGRRGPLVHQCTQEADDRDMESGNFDSREIATVVLAGEVVAIARRFYDEQFVTTLDFVEGQYSFVDGDLEVTAVELEPEESSKKAAAPSSAATEGQLADFFKNFGK